VFTETNDNQPTILNQTTILLNPQSILIEALEGVVIHSRHFSSKAMDNYPEFSRTPAHYGIGGLLWPPSIRGRCSGKLSPMRRDTCLCAVILGFFGLALGFFGAILSDFSEKLRLSNRLPPVDKFLCFQKSGLGFPTHPRFRLR
jgi:hypothetical protein